MAGCSVLMYKINAYTNPLIDDLVQNLENNILDETRTIIDEYDDDSLSGTYVYSEISKSREYNFEQNKFEIVTQKKYVAIEFHSGQYASLQCLFIGYRAAARPGAVDLFFLSRHEKPNNRTNQDHWRYSDKQPFKCMKCCSENGGFRITVIPIQVGTF